MIWYPVSRLVDILGSREMQASPVILWCDPGISTGREIERQIKLLG